MNTLVGIMWLVVVLLFGLLGTLIFSFIVYIFVRLVDLTVRLLGKYVFNLSNECIERSYTTQQKRYEGNYKSPKSYLVNIIQYLVKDYYQFWFANLIKHNAVGSYSPFDDNNTKRNKHSPLALIPKLLDAPSDNQAYYSPPSRTSHR
jgi:hypothetical protein